MRKLGYFTEWSVYRENSKSIEELVVEGTYTDVIYAFAIFDKSGKLNFGDPYAANDKHILRDLVSLKNSGQISKIGISIGGWNNRADFEKLECHHIAASMVEFVTCNGFEIVDIDWEFDSPEAARKYQSKFKKLISVLKKGLSQHVELMVSLHCNIKTIQALDLSEIEQHVSLFNVMGYDLSGSWSAVSEHYASLSTVSKVVESLSQSAPLSKICIGVSGFGARFNGCKGIGCKFSSFDLVTMKELVVKSTHWCEESQSSFCHCGDESVVSIESYASFACKLEFVNGMGLAGICVWDIEAFSHIL